MAHRTGWTAKQKQEN